VRWVPSWLEVTPGQGREAVEHAYREVLDGRVAPAAGHILSLAG